MSEYRFETNFIIDNIEEATKWLRQRSGKSEITLEAVLKKINLDEEHVFYFDEKLNLKEKGESEVHYVWIDTELHEPQGNKELFLSLYYLNGEFTGHYIGTIAFQAKKMAENHPWDSQIILENKGIIERKYIGILSKRHERMTVSTKLANEVDGILKIDYFTSLNGLKAFICKIGRRIYSLKRKNKTQYYVINSLENVIVNTGMLNKENRDILLFYRWNSTEDMYKADAIINSEEDYLKYGFTRKQSVQVLTPISFSEDLDSRLRGCSFPNDQKEIVSFLKERHAFLPPAIRSMPRTNVVQCIEKSMNSGIAIQKHDKTYIKPVYSAKNGNIAYLMPLHIMTDYSSEPDMVMSFRIRGDKLEIKNLLPYDDSIKDGITAMDLYGNIW